MSEDKLREALTALGVMCRERSENVAAFPSVFRQTMGTVSEEIAALLAANPPEAPSERSTMSSVRYLLKNHAEILRKAADDLEAMREDPALAAPAVVPVDASLRKAAKRMLEAIDAADANEDLPDQIDGSLIDDLRLALQQPQSEGLREQIAKVFLEATEPAKIASPEMWAKAEKALAFADAILRLLPPSNTALRKAFAAGAEWYDTSVTVRPTPKEMEAEAIRRFPEKG